MRIGDRLAAVLARAERRDIVHRARPVERDQRDDVARSRSASPPPACAACLPIRAGTRRPCRRAGAARRPPDRPRAIAVEIDRRCRARRAVRPPCCSTDSVLRPRKSNFTSPARLDIFHVELGDRHVRARIAVERDQLGERAVADHHAGGVGRGVARQALELHRQVEQAADLGRRCDIRRRAR